MKSIFIVDDSQLHNILLKKILDSSGYQVSAFTDGFSLLENLQHSKPHLIISDINMPNLNGFDLCRQIRKNPGCTDIPLMYVSSMQGEKVIRQSHDCGAVGLVAKPIEKDPFLALVARNVCENDEV